MNREEKQEKPKRFSARGCGRKYYDSQKNARRLLKSGAPRFIMEKNNSGEMTLKKRWFAAALAAVMLFSFSGCKGKTDMTGDLTEDPATESQPVKEDPYTTNPLTGVKNLDKSKVSLRPVAVMINNIRIAQQVQTSVQKADVIYETEIEGGITRLMAVFKDIGEIGQLGTVRSARYAFIDLALGYDAIYVHCGIDPTYAAPHVQSSGVADFNINSNPFAAYGFREKNGLSYEHTMYTSGEKLQEGFQNLEVRTTTQKTDSWCHFLPEDAPVVPSGGKADEKVTVKFSGIATSVFTYDSATKLYTKNSANCENKDSKTGDPYQVTNVFVLETSITNYPDGYHRNIQLIGGTGYYASHGGYQPISWKKEGENAPIQFYAADGTALNVNPGKSWVCITNANFAPIFEGTPDPEPSSSAAQ